MEANAIDMMLCGHCPIEADKGLCARCYAACKIEENIVHCLKVIEIEAHAKKSITTKRNTKWDYHSENTSRTQMSMCQCLFPTCTLVCHLLMKESSNKRLIFKLNRKVSGDRRELINDANSLRRMISMATPGGIISCNDVYKCIGIESFLSSDVARKTVQKHYAHASGIIAEQVRQHGSWGYSDEDLHCVS